MNDTLPVCLAASYDGMHLATCREHGSHGSRISIEWPLGFVSS
jgi:hypothetical protein